MTDTTAATTAALALPPIPSRRSQGLEEGLPAALYLAGSTALRDFLRPLGVTGFKAGLSGRRHVEDRILDLRNRRYAAIVADLADRSVALVDHPLGREWFLTPLPDCSGVSEVADWLAKLPSGEFRNGTIMFRVPNGIQLASLEKRFQSALYNRNLNAYLDTDDGKKRLAEAGLATTTRLFTDYDMPGSTRRSLACELFCVRPTRETAVLLQALVLALQQEQAARK
jgi:hypothetical protein